MIRLLHAGERVQLIDGTIVYDTEETAPLPAHGATQVKLGAVLDPFHRRAGGSRGPGGWWLMTEVDVEYRRTSQVYRHDVLGLRRETCPELPDAFPLRVRPDWVCEILSPRTAKNDVGLKRRTLHAHGVPHYWLIHPQDQTLTVLRWTEAGYLHVLGAGVGDRVRAEPFDAIELSVGELFGHEEPSE